MYLPEIKSDMTFSLLGLMSYITMKEALTKPD